MSSPAANCPNCGAPVKFLWSSAVQTTCEFCHSILVRTDVDLKKVGEVADLPPDASPIQIGTEGAYQNKSFVVVGRIIYEYELGGWNEWHIVYNDGSSGWLADAQLEYDLSWAIPPSTPLPASDQIRQGNSFQWSGKTWRALPGRHPRLVRSGAAVINRTPPDREEKFVDLRAARSIASRVSRRKARM